MQGRFAAGLGAWRTNDRPLARSLADAVRDAVIDGRIPAGAALPSERELARMLDVSRGTVVAALALLLVDAGTASPGLPRLRELVAERYTRAGLPTRVEQVLVTSGAQVALTLLDDHLHQDRRAPVLVESPTFPGALTILRRRRARLVIVPVTAGAGWDIEQMAHAVPASGARLCYLVPDFHNPTGAHMSDGIRTAVSTLAERYGLTVVADETMRDLDLRSPPRPSPHLCGPSVINVGSMSKTVWSGLRVGWIRASAALIGELLRNPLQAQLSGRR